ncbi:MULTISPECIES: NAD(P)H-flavin reductase [Thiomicrorhabdus]|uniref:NAD(P)H-flavin reductase n=1 Tax=Thiomicrorhabdus heinhorstiae TaxID=2748010 RepID=A0ABS0C3Z1_9GAMM|nr:MULTISPECIES: NAD(P)H-flavin reductase [Thiomicrorhabdus]MBF6058967.1 NAD(P)H-flavin reductase [Thiomicrorhabdus heinhorstiae]
MAEATHLMIAVQVETLAPNIVRLFLKAEHPISYSAGQYVMLGFDTEELKPFSIASAPREDGLLEFHIRNHDNSNWMKRLVEVKTGDRLVMQGPKDQMSLQPAHQPIIFVAGGTGFSPLKAMLDELLRHDIEVPIHFFWGARRREELYLHNEMIELSQQHGNLDYIPVISDNFHDWNGLTGLVHKQVLAMFPNLHHHTLYICGPWGMIETAKAEFLAAGLDEKNCIH